MPRIGEDPELHPAKLSLVTRNIAISIRIRVKPMRALQTMHTSRSQSRGKSHVSHAKNERDMQREIDELKKKLRRAR